MVFQIPTLPTGAVAAAAKASYTEKVKEQYPDLDFDYDRDLNEVQRYEYKAQFVTPLHAMMPAATLEVLRALRKELDTVPVGERDAKLTEILMNLEMEQLLA